MYQPKLDKKIKEWAVSLPYNDMKNPNEITDINFNPDWKNIGDIFFTFERV